VKFKRRQPPEPIKPMANDPQQPPSEVTEFMAREMFSVVEQLRGASASLENVLTEMSEKLTEEPKDE
jgi:hypothetical protein